MQPTSLLTITQSFSGVASGHIFFMYVRQKSMHMTLGLTLGQLQFPSQLACKGKILLLLFSHISAFEIFSQSLHSYSLANGEQIIHGKYAFLIGFTCAQSITLGPLVFRYNLDRPGDPPVEMTHTLPSGETVRNKCQVLP